MGRKNLIASVLTAGLGLWGMDHFNDKAYQFRNQMNELAPIVTPVAEMRRDLEKGVKYSVASLDEYVETAQKHVETAQRYKAAMSDSTTINAFSRYEEAENNANNAEAGVAFSLLGLALGLTRITLNGAAGLHRFRRNRRAIGSYNISDFKEDDGVEVFFFRDLLRKKLNVYSRDYPGKIFDLGRWEALFDGNNFYGDKIVGEYDPHEKKVYCFDESLRDRAEEVRIRRVVAKLK